MHVIRDGPRRPSARPLVVAAAGLAALALVVSLARSHGKPPLAGLTTVPGFPACGAAIAPFAAGTTLHEQWVEGSPPADATFDLRGVTSTAYPSSADPSTSVFAIGVTHAAPRTCVVGGELRGSPDPTLTWEYFHDHYNAACLKMVATDWMQVRGLRCNGVEDGFRPRETRDDANDVRLFVTGTYFTEVRDDCMENDGTIGGLLYDNLWEQCNTGISERPSASMGTWTSPTAETLTLDHMLIGLSQTPHAQGVGENALFKWSSSADHLVIECSIFRVDAVSLNGAGAMAIPAGTAVDDSACPNHPSTIVWTGGGPYPAPTQGLRVTSDVGVWDRAVATWKCDHGYGACPSTSSAGS